MLQLGADPHPVLKGEIPVNCLEYVMAALGCFLSPEDVGVFIIIVMLEKIIGPKVISKSQFIIYPIFI